MGPDFSSKITALRLKNDRLIIRELLIGTVIYLSTAMQQPSTFLVCHQVYTRFDEIEQSVSKTRKFYCATHSNSALFSRKSTLEPSFRMSLWLLVRE